MTSTALPMSQTTSAMPSAPSAPRISRNALIAGGVVVLHVGMLWLLQTGLLRRAVEIIVPVALLSEMITPPAPKVEPPPTPRPPEPQQPVKKAEPRLPPPPVPQAIADPTPAPNAPTGTTAPQPPAPPMAAPVAPAAAAPAAPPAPARIELPSSDAAYLQNPPLTYPSMSTRLGEQGKVLVRVLIGADGRPQKAELKRTSGFDRLDRAALDYVMKCRYVPGTVGGTPQAMWYEAPVDFILK